MRTEDFWRIVEEAHKTASGDDESMYDTLSRLLTGRTKAEIEAFQRVLVSQSRRVYTRSHGDAAGLVCGYLGDDGYTDFRSWMLAQGAEVFDAFVTDPDTLADVEDIEDACTGSGEVSPPPLRTATSRSGRRGLRRGLPPPGAA